jgi:hypothetical protein
MMNKKLMKIFAALWVLAFALGVAGQERFVRPVDEAGEDKSFLEFRTKLIAAAERKDREHILSILDPDISSSFGGHHGVEGFKELWEFAGENTRFWDEFLKVLRNGGMWYREEGRRTIFTAPYIFEGFPGDLDSFEHGVVFGTNVNLREKPSVDSKVVAQLSHNVVRIEETKLTEDDGRPDWYRVKTLGGKAGWVKGDYIRSPIDYRAGFEKKGGKWKMIFFIAGD